MNEIPVAAPGDLAIVAVMSPNPTEHIERKIMKINAIAIANPPAPPDSRYPIRKDRTTTIITCKTEISVFDMT